MTTYSKCKKPNISCRNNTKIGTKHTICVKVTGNKQKIITSYLAFDPSNVLSIVSRVLCSQQLLKKPCK